MIMKVIDISKYQGKIDFAKVKRSGVKGVVIRVGFRGWGSGQLVQDERFRENVRGAVDAGIPFGIYFFSQATNAAEGREEAAFAIEALRSTGERAELPIYIDTEASGAAFSRGRADKISRGDRTSAVLSFLKYAEARGYYAGVYASTSWFNTKLYDENLLSYDHWVAHYAPKCGYRGSKGMWQYSSKGSVDGISGRCDLNECYRDYPVIIRNAGLNGLNGIPEKPKLVTVQAGPMTAGDAQKFKDLASELKIDFKEV